MVSFTHTCVKITCHDLCFSKKLPAILSFTPIAAVGQTDEKYEKPSSSEFKIMWTIPKGAVFTFTNGITNGGPIKELSFWEHKIALTNNGMIKDGFITTREYGKFKIVNEPKTGTFRVYLTPSQQKKLLELKGIK